MYTIINYCKHPGENDANMYPLKDMKCIAGEEILPGENVLNYPIPRDRYPAGSARLRNRTILTVASVILGMLLLVSSAGANDYFGYIPLTTERQGVVSGGLYIDAYPGFAKTGEKEFYLPNYSSIEWARLYVGVYCGNMKTNYPVLAHVMLDRNGDGSYETALADEKLDVAYTYPGEGGTGPVYVNDHVNRVTSDYVMWYDVRSQIDGRYFGAQVKSDPINSSSSLFDGRVKFIALVVAYNDTDTDRVYYWVNQGHDAMQTSKDNGYKGETTFTTSEITGTEDREDDIEAKLYVLHMASEDGSYTFNSEELDSPTILQKGSYFGEDTWTVTDSVKYDESSTLSYTEGEGSTSSISSGGAYYKIPLAMLTVTIPELPAGSLNVTSNPPGAEIFLDDEATGQKTNTTLARVVEGDHAIRVTFPNTSAYREPDEAGVTIKKNKESKVHFDFKPITGSIEIETSPADAWVFLDGKNQSVLSGTTLKDVLIGEHVITVKKAGYRNSIANVTVTEGQTEVISLTLNETKSTGTSGLAEGSDSETIQEPVGYSGKNLTLYKHGFVAGGLLMSDAGEYTGLLPKGASKTYPLTVNLPENATVTDARLYVYTTWSYNTGTKQGVPASLQVTQGENTLETDRIYSDRKGGNQTYDYPAGTYAYSLDTATIQNGTMTFTVTNTGGDLDEFATYGVMLVAAYEEPRGQTVEYWITEGCDLLYANPVFGIDSANATTLATFSGEIDRSHVIGATLASVSTAASGGSDDDNLILFNDQQWQNLMRGGSSGISREELDVKNSLLSSDNTASIRSFIQKSKGDYMENRNLILVIKENPIAASAENTSLVTANFTDLGGSNSTVSPDLAENISSAASLNSTGANVISSLSSPIASVSDVVIPESPVEETVDQANRFYDVRIRSNPPNALISVDYEYTGKITPDTVSSLRGGNHTISIELKGFKTIEDRVFISDNQTLTYELSTHGTTAYLKEKTDEDLLDEELYGGVYVASTPDAAMIYIDGKKTSLVTPNVVYGLKPGKHAVRVKVNSSDTEFPVDTKNVMVDAGVITRVSFMEVEMPYFASPTINSTTYLGRTFTLNGQTLKYTIPAQVDLQVADNFLTIKTNDSYLSLTVFPGLNLSTIEVEPRNPTTYRNLYVVSEPTGADVYVDGYATGHTTPYLVRNVSDQKHLISVSKPGYVPMESTVYVSDQDLVRRFVLAEYLYGSLEVSSTPSGGKIYINNKDTSQKTPFTFQYLKAGEYNVKVVLNKTQDSATEQMVEPFRTTRLNFDLSGNETAG